MRSFKLRPISSQAQSIIKQSLLENELSNEVVKIINKFISAKGDLNREDRLLVDTALSLWAQLPKHD